MLSEADRAVLDESFQNTRMAGEAIHMVIGKVEDEDLALDLNRQACRFLQFEEKLQQVYDIGRRDALMKMRDLKCWLENH